MTQAQRMAEFTAKLVQETKTGFEAIELVRPRNGRDFVTWCVDIANELAALDTSTLEHLEARRKAGL